MNCVQPNKTPSPQEDFSTWQAGVHSQAIMSHERVALAPQSLTRQNLYRTFVAGLCLLSAVEQAQARTAGQVESTYLGRGLFRYKVANLPVPNAGQYALTEFSLSPIDASASGAAPQEWVFSIRGNNWVSFSYTPATPPTPTDQFAYTFYVQASTTNYTVVTNNAISRMNANYPDGTSGVSYRNFTCIVPSSTPTPAGTPTNFVSETFFPCEVKIDKLHMTNSQPCGFSFTANARMLLQVQGTTNFHDWTNIGGSVRAVAGTNTWYASQPFGASGSSFRAKVTGGY